MRQKSLACLRWAVRAIFWPVVYALALSAVLAIFLTASCMVVVERLHVWLGSVERTHSVQYWMRDLLDTMRGHFVPTRESAKRA